MSMTCPNCEWVGTPEVDIYYGEEIWVCADCGCEVTENGEGPDTEER